MRLRYYLAFMLIFIVIMISSLFVNPVNIGLGDRFNNNLPSTVQSKKTRSECPLDRIDGSSMGSYLYALGIKDLDGTDYYPDMKK
ncbi:hypothetical protein [Sporolactobacillus sp. KGMB 08714]|uniref:hypothetical protein n=1 Tax=Sporolactobacillus sp. KGMB 08714 TaxID=3064704 RepID=UPI002FBE3833